MISYAANPCNHCTFEGSLLLGRSLLYVVHLAAGTGGLSCLSVSSQNILDASCCGTLILGKTELDVIYIIGSAYLAEVEDDAVGILRVRTADADGTTTTRSTIGFYDLIGLKLVRWFIYESRFY